MDYYKALYIVKCIVQVKIKLHFRTYAYEYGGMIITKPFGAV